MLEAAIILFAIAAIGGATMAIMHFRGTTPPKVALAVVHGLFAASGLVVLLIAAFTQTVSGGTRIALGLFILAALGGFGLLSYHMRRRGLPNGLVVAHGLIAVVAFLILLGGLLGWGG